MVGPDQAFMRCPGPGLYQFLREKRLNVICSILLVLKKVAYFVIMLHPISFQISVTAIQTFQKRYILFLCIKGFMKFGCVFFLLKVFAFVKIKGF